MLQDQSRWGNCAYLFLLPFPPPPLFILNLQIQESRYGKWKLSAAPIVSLKCPLCNHMPISSHKQSAASACIPTQNYTKMEG